MKKTNQLVNKVKENRGITLIALVITIIVLLILAGVAVSSITGSEGVMDKAQNAKVATDNANEEEEIKMAAVTAMADNMEGLGVLTADKLSKALNNKYPVVDEGDKIKVFAINEYTLDKNGNVKNDGETPKGEFSIELFSYTPNTVSIGGTSVEPVVNISGTPYKGPKYTSSDTDKATVDETTGVVTGKVSGTVTVTVTYKNYQNVEVTRTTTVTVRPAFTTQNFSYTGTVQSCELPAGKYKLEVWGAQGANCTTDDCKQGGLGGYSTGILNITNNTTVYIYVGRQGIKSSNVTGYCFNGGGYGGTPSGGGYSYSGGGATDIALYGTNNSSNWNNTNHFYSRIIVAGGGGGAANNYGYSTSYGAEGGYGGGINGATGGTSKSGENYTRTGGGGGTQTSGGSAGVHYSGSYYGYSGSFGLGAYAPTESQDAIDPGGGGGGWYGRWNWMPCTEEAEAGGSGYVYTSSTSSNYPSGCLLNSSYYLTNASTIAGNASMPKTSGTGNETGHSGNGYARISTAD